MHLKILQIKSFTEQSSFIQLCSGRAPVSETFLQ